MLVLLVVYWLTMPKVITFEDAGLFLQVCHFQGIAHPPGYPLFTLLCIPWFWLPVDPVILGNMLSAIFAAFTCVVVYFIVRRMHVNEFTAVVTSLLFGLSRDFWSQAIIVEVYTLNTLLISVAIYLAVSFSSQPKKEYIYLLSLMFGLAISNHWPLVILTSPGIAVICLSRSKELARIIFKPLNVVICLFLIGIGLLPYLYIVMNQGLRFSFSGPVSNIGEFISYFMRDAFASVDQSSTAGPEDKLKFVGWLLKRASFQFGLIFMLVSIVGLIRGLMTTRFLALGLLVAFLGNTVVLVLLLGFDFDYLHQSVFRPYPLVAWLCMALWFGAGLNWLLDLVKRHQLLLRLVPCLILLFVLGNNLQANDRHEDVLADRYARLVLESLERDASLVITSDPQVGSISYVQQVAGLRKDVTLYEAGNLFLPNKLPGGSMSEVREFLSGLDSVYLIGVPWLSGNVDYGLYEAYGSGAINFRIVPGLSEFVEELVFDFQNDNINSPGARYFAHQLLIALGNQLTHYAFTHEITEDELVTMQSVQKTFPGILAALSVSLANPQYPMPDAALISLALPFDGRFGDETSDYEIASYYYYIAMLLTYPDESLAPDEELALAYLLQGFETYPVGENPGVCLGLSLAQNNGLQVFSEFESECL
jgi:hypothetical protein